MRPLFVAAAALSSALLIPHASRGAEDPAVLRGAHFLMPRVAGQQVGEAAMMGMALIKADVPPNDPAVVASLGKIRGRFASSGYTPQRTGGHDVYEAAAVAMALANIDADSSRAELNTIAQYLVSKQKPNGSWDYNHRTAGDTSISQYAVLGLWEAENAGAYVPGEVWDRAARWFLSSQGSSGGWMYQRDDPSKQANETVSMTAAGVGSLLICNRQLQRYRRGSNADHPLLVPLTLEGARRLYKVETTATRIENAVKRGISWLGAHFNPRGGVMGPSAYYGLYGVERIGSLAARDALGRVDWFEQGRSFILGSQAADGAWNSSHGQDMNTVWAILFLTRSTAKTLRRIEVKRLGAGTLLGGRGLPKDLSSMTVAGGRVVSRPMNGAVEGMLAVLEDPRAEDAGSALAGLVDRYQAGGPPVLRPHKDRFRKMLNDRDPGLRRVATWGLARMGDLDAAPLLIGAITDADEDVVAEARRGLQLLSRKLEGYGPPTPSTPAQRDEAAKRWREWYDAIRPIGLEGRQAAASGAGIGGRP